MVGFGALAWATDLRTAIVVAGAAMLALGLFVAVRFSENGFEPTRHARWRESVSIFRRGVDLARGDREILLVFGATLLTNGAAEGFGRLFPKQLVLLGFPAKPDPIVWFTALGLLTLGNRARWRSASSRRASPAPAFHGASTRRRASSVRSA